MDNKMEQIYEIFDQDTKETICTVDDQETAENMCIELNRLCKEHGGSSTQYSMEPVTQNK